MTLWHAVAFGSGVIFALGWLDWRKGRRISAVLAWVIAGASFAACMVLS